MLYFLSSLFLAHNINVYSPNPNNTLTITISPMCTQRASAYVQEPSLQEYNSIAIMMGGVSQRKKKLSAPIDLALPQFMTSYCDSIR